jgi:hypothetical protein
MQTSLEIAAELAAQTGVESQLQAENMQNEAVSSFASAALGAIALAASVVPGARHAKRNGADPLSQQDEMARTLNHMMSTINEPISSVVAAGLANNAAAAEELARLLEGYLQVLGTFVENAHETRTQSTRAFDEAVQLLQAIADADYQAHSLGRGA